MSAKVPYERGTMRPSVEACLSIAVVWVAACGGQPALLRQIEKLGLVNNIQSRLLESVEAEKSAVLANTDEESIAFATQSKHSAEEIDGLKTRLAELIAEDARPGEGEKLTVFDAKWDELKAVDARLLGLAVANTNLKAARLVTKEASAALDRFITSVDTITLASSNVAVVRSLATAATAVARIQSLLFVHIPEGSEAEMTALETRIRTLSGTVDTALREAVPLAPSTVSAAASDASQAWTEYQRIMAEVIRLSRLNTNVISFDVSTHEKRAATRACLDALADLRSAIQGGPHATR
jgi:hypothetical protein